VAAFPLALGTPLAPCKAKPTERPSMARETGVVARSAGRLATKRLAVFSKAAPGRRPAANVLSMACQVPLASLKWMGDWKTSVR